MARKVYCENTSCKHYQGKDVCDTTVKIGSNGKCKSFEKGFVYYFHRVWDELGNSNYIDFVKINRDDDLRIGIFMVCKVYGINFSEMEWGLCRILMFKESPKGEALHYDDIVSREMNHEEFDKLYRDFQNGILPSVTHEKTKKDSQPFGRLSPMGEFTEGDFAEHEEVAERIIEKSGFGDEYDDWLMSNGEGVTCRDFLAEVKGYCLIHNPAGYGGYIVSNVKPLTKKQKEFLYEYFTDIGDRFKAEQYIE